MYDTKKKLGYAMRRIIKDKCIKRIFLGLNLRCQCAFIRDKKCEMC